MKLSTERIVVIEPLSVCTTYLKNRVFIMCYEKFNKVHLIIVNESTVVKRNEINSKEIFVKKKKKRGERVLNGL